MTTAPTGYLFTLSHCDGDPDRAATALSLANNALAAGADTLLWLTVDGAKLARHGGADGLLPRSFPPLSELLSMYIECGGRIGVCPPCGKTHGVTDANILANAEWMGASALLVEAQGRQVFSF